MNHNKEEQASEEAHDSDELVDEFDEKLALKEQHDERDALDEHRQDVDDLLCDSPNVKKTDQPQEQEATRNDAEFQHIFNQFETVDKENGTSPEGSSEQQTDEPQYSEKPPSTEAQKQKADTSNQEQIPFDFNKFLTQMRRRDATPITRYFKSFLQAFERRSYSVSEQVKIIQDFLEFIYGKMRECDVWRNTSEQEFENAQEGMEKLVMNRLYNVTFSPSTTDDKERDEILHQKISIFQWIRENHLDIPATEHNDSFMIFAQSELLKINSYKAPRDKLICILNCCKVIFGLLKHVEVDGEAGADKFLPILIYVVIRSNPPRLVSNVQYISRFRSPERLQSESDYFLTNMMGAISFIETMEAKSLSITKEEFDANIERTVAKLKQEQPSVARDKQQVNYENAVHPARFPQPRPLIDPAKTAALLEKGSNFAQKTMQKPLNFVEKIFQGFGEGSRPSSPEEGEAHHHQHDVRYATPSGPHYQGQALPRPRGPSVDPNMPLPSPRLEQKFDMNLKTIAAMFPNVETEVRFMVLQANQGDVAKTVDDLLEMTKQPESPDNNQRHPSSPPPPLSSPRTPPSHPPNQSPRSMPTKDTDNEDLIKM